MILPLFSLFFQYFLNFFLGLFFCISDFFGLFYAYSEIDNPLPLFSISFSFFNLSSPQPISYISSLVDLTLHLDPLASPPDAHWCDGPRIWDGS